MKSNSVEDSFSISERLFIVASLFLFIFDLNSFSYGASSNLQICWPHFPSCREWLPLLERLPSSYAHQVLFAIVFLFITLAFITLLKNRRGPTLVLLATLTVFKVFYHFVWKYSGNHNFEYFHLIPTIAFLLNYRDRVFGAQIAWVTLYFLAAFVKIDESWIAGTYFSTLELGLPLFPNSWIPFVGQIVIIAECFLSWGLLSKRFHRVSFVFWLLFHLYSVFLVGFFYPTRGILFLIVLFLDRPFFSPYHFKLNLGTMSLLVFILIVQVGWIGMPENTRSTLRFEGYGFNMFDSNFQCVSQIKMNQNGSQTAAIEEYSHARFRCGARLFLDRYKQNCKNRKLDSMEWKLWQSTNGGPFYEIVNTSNACELEFSLFGDNAWIDTERSQAVGYPRKNAVDSEVRRSSSDLVQIVYDHPIEFLSPVQTKIINHLDVFKVFYYLIWMAVLIFICWLYFTKKKL